MGPRVRLASALLTIHLGAIATSAQVLDTDTRSIPAMPQPGYLESFVDPVFGATISRITGIPGAPIPGVRDGVWSDIARHGYSKRSTWNCDQSLLLLGRHKGSPPMLFLDGTTYEPRFGRQSPGTETRWHGSRPSYMIFVRDDVIGLWNVTTNVIDTLRIFEGYADLHMGPWEGNLSRDGQLVALNGQRGNEAVAFAYELTSGTKHADLLLSGIELDWVSISASGRYIVVNGGFAENGDQTQVYDLDGHTVGELWHEYGRPSHYDLSLDTDSEDVAVGVSKSAPDDGRVIKRRLRDGNVTVLTDGGYASHTSTRNVDRPGWAYVSFQHPGPTWPPYWNEVVAVSLAGGRVERIAHMHALQTDYEAEAHAVPSPDGQRVLFASNWGESSGRPVAAYVATLPGSDR
jgi:hypothetical protein